MNESDEKYGIAIPNSMSGQLVIADTTKWKMDVVCNGFSIKDTILEVLRGADLFYCCPDREKLAQDITDALAEKLHLKQG